MVIQKSIRRAEDIFHRHGGLLRTSKALALGVHPRTLYQAVIDPDDPVAALALSDGHTGAAGRLQPQKESPPCAAGCL